MWYIWLGVVIFALIVELSTSEMVSIWFVCGGFFSLIMSLCGLTWYFTVPTFIIISVVALLVFRKMVMEKLNKSDVKTNADATVGKDFRLITPISFEKPGSIRVNDVVWSAITENPEEEVNKGTIVTVKKIKGNKFIVEVKK